MDKNLRDLLEEKGENYILPFMWMHGEEEPILREEMKRIFETGIKAVCIESRPHPDFAGPLWWRDLDIVMDEAKRLGMQVWVLDDSHFPTGYANGWIKDKYPEKGKLYLVEKHVEACGPLLNASFIIDGWLNQKERIAPQARHFDDDTLLAVIASRRNGSGDDIDETLMDITTNVSNGTLYWDVPEGLWRIFILYGTRNGGGNPDYINLIDPDSVKVLIDAVYEPHYFHYKDDFGSTFAGFFSDEPEFGNTKGYNFDESIGRKKMPLPWCKGLPELLEKVLGKDYRRLLPLLWYNAGDRTGAVRYHYMDSITRLYARSFSGQLGKWCREHNVKYIGHVIEDQNVHARLGCGTGHYFRSLSGQDMSGVDVVNQQIIPGFDSVGHDRHNTTCDGEFFHFALAKMGASLGHIDPLKRRRTFCELYGAFGWAEGLKLMKWLTDHMLVRGINWLVPHAFSPKEYPDADCPPHFYARGRNPQYRYMGVLMGYANRICHLLNHGIHVAPVAILYHAEAEWSGDYMFFQKPARLLAQNQIDYDILPSDVFDNMDFYHAYIEGDNLCVNGEKYHCLVIPYSQHITAAVARFIENAANNGLEIIFIEGMPDGICGEVNRHRIAQQLKKLERCQKLALEKLIPYLQNKGIAEIKLSSTQPYLRYYHYRRGENDILMFFNEHPYHAICTEVDISWCAHASGKVFIYNGFDNTLMPAVIKNDSGTRMELNLSPYESMIVIFGDVPEEYLIQKTQGNRAVNSGMVIKPGEIGLDNPWKVSMATASEYPRFTEKLELTKLKDLSAPGCFPSFSGTIRYETTFGMEDESGSVELDLGSAYEVAEVWVNGEHAGVKICPPYRFDISGLQKLGLNSLRVDVTNTLVREQRDKFSKCISLEPSGLLGPVLLRYGQSKK